MHKFHISLPAEGTPRLENLIDAIREFYADEPIEVADALEISTPSDQVAAVLDQLFPGARVQPHPGQDPEASSIPAGPVKRTRKPRKKKDAGVSEPGAGDPETGGAEPVVIGIREHIDAKRQERDAAGEAKTMSLVGPALVPAGPSLQPADPPQPAPSTTTGLSVIIDDRPADVLRTIKRNGAIGTTRF